MKFEYWLSNIYIDNTKKINLKRSGIDAKTLFYMKNDELEKLQILTGKDIEKIDRSRPVSYTHLTLPTNSLV